MVGALQVGAPSRVFDAVVIKTAQISDRGISGCRGHDRGLAVLVAVGAALAVFAGLDHVVAAADGAVVVDGAEIGRAHV